MTTVYNEGDSVRFGTHDDRMLEGTIHLDYPYRSAGVSRRLVTGEKMVTEFGWRVKLIHKADFGRFPQTIYGWIDNIDDPLEIGYWNSKLDATIVQNGVSMIQILEPDKPWWWDTERCPNCKDAWVEECGCYNIVEDRTPDPPVDPSTGGHVWNGIGPVAA